MLFNSIDFALFLPLVFLAYWFFSFENIKVKNLILLMASYIFYAWWDWRFLILIIGSSLLDFTVGKLIYNTTDERKRNRFLWLSIGFNIGLLGFFKYFNFFLDSFVSAFTLFGFEISSQRLNIILPVGISFYTFQTLSYTIDIYRKKLKPTEDIISFFAFVSFFPQLVAGPIERAGNLLPQFKKTRNFNAKMMSYGIKLMIWGFFLKLVVADRAAIYVNAVYNNIENHEGLTFIAATLLFAFQIYGDFAGYSLIAIGTAKLFGFDLMTNFRRPYFSASVSEFWTRWHISLSTWFRDYVYIPLGGNQVSKPRWLVNLFLTFLISGLWHGANWTFIAWGALNGFYLILEVLFFKKKRNGILNILLTFVLINFSWIFFRASSMADAFYIIGTIFNKPGHVYIGSGDDIAAALYSCIAIAMLVSIEIKREYLNTFLVLTDKYYGIVRFTAYAILIFVILYLGVFDESQFIYFQF